MAACTAASTFRCVVSSSCASGAGFSGATARERSRSSRRRMSARIAASSASCPAALSSSARRRARSSGAATTKIFTSASRADDRADVAPVEHGARRRCRRSRAGTRAARRAPRGSPRRSRPPRRWRGLSATFSSNCRRIERARRRDRAAPCRRAAVRHRAAPWRPRDRSARCRDGAGGNASASRLPSVPLPDAAGPSMAMIMRALNRARRARSSDLGARPAQRAFFCEYVARAEFGGAGEGEVFLHGRSRSTTS